MFLLLIISLFNIIFVRNKEGFFIGISGVAMSIIFIICDSTESVKLKSNLFPFFIMVIILFALSSIYAYIKSISSYRKIKKG